MLKNRKTGLSKDKLKSIEKAASKRIYNKGIVELEAKVEDFKEREKQHMKSLRDLFTDNINALIDAQRKLAEAANNEAQRRVKHHQLFKQAGDVAFMRNAMVLSYAWPEIMQDKTIAEFLRGRVAGKSRTIPMKMYMAKLITLLYMDMYVLTSVYRIKIFLGFDPTCIRSIIASLYQANYIESLSRAGRTRTYALTEKAMPVVNAANAILNKYTGASRSASIQMVQAEGIYFSKHNISNEKKSQIVEKLDLLNEKYKEYNRVAADIIEELNESEDAANGNEGTEDSIPAE